MELMPMEKWREVFRIELRFELYKVVGQTEAALICSLFVGRVAALNY